MNLSGDRNSGVDRVRDDEKAGLRAGLSGVLDEVGHDASCSVASECSDTSPLTVRDSSW